MPVFQLQPIDPGDECWQASMWNGIALVRASCEERARAIATFAFGRGVGVEGAGHDPGGPWIEDAKALCKRVLPVAYAEDGPEAVLAPAEYNTAWDRHFGGKTI